MIRRLAFACGVFLSSFLCSLPINAATNDNKSAADSSQNEVHRLLGQAQAAELDGDETKREALLRDVLAIDPDCKLARWQLGQVEIDSQWHSISDIQRQTAADPRYAKYPDLRAEYGQTAKGHLALAQWCKRQGLPQEANFHWAAVLSFEPNHEEALRELGKRWVEGRLLTYDERIELQQARKRTREASQKWSTKLAGWKRAITSAEVADRMRAQGEIRSINDPHSIEAIEETTLASVGDSKSKQALSRHIGLAFVEALQGMEIQLAANSLARHAVYAPTLEVRYAAAEALRARSYYSYVPQLLDALSMPIESTFSIQTDSDGSVYYHHELFREGAFSDAQLDRQLTVRQIDQKGKVRIFYLRQRKMEIQQESDESVANKKAKVAERENAKFVSMAVFTENQVARKNRAATILNLRLINVLQHSTGQDLGNDPREWWNWWQGFNEYHVEEERPTYVENYFETEQHQYRKPCDCIRPSCFAAGTLVWTKSGQRPIESLEIGDLVLSQDVESGELDFQPVIGRTLRPPSAILKFAYEDETLRTTLGHPLWVAGKGWRMAKQIEEGTMLHSVNGPLIVESIQSDGEEPAYNLVVANTNNYFVGERGVLVHDNTPQTPTRAKLPGWIAATSAP